MSNPLRDRLEHREDVISSLALRNGLSEALSRAAYGQRPLLVMRRGRRIAALISIPDLELLLRMRRKRADALARELPADHREVGPAMAQLLKDELDLF